MGLASPERRPVRPRRQRPREQELLSLKPEFNVPIRGFAIFFPEFIRQTRDVVVTWLLLLNKLWHTRCPFVMFRQPHNGLSKAI